MAAHIQTVIKHLNDSVNGLEECTKLTDNDSLKTLLHKFSSQRKSFAQTLAAHCHDGDGVTDKGSIAGSLHQAFIQLKAMVKDSSAEDVKKEILRGDKVLIDAYNDALKHESNDALKKLLSDQLHAVHQGLVETVNKL